jgi:membrane-associated protein
MEFIKFIIDFILHIDVHLGEIINTFGLWTYAILFLIIFVETGLVVTPFLPGDSLLFAAGALVSSLGVMDIKLLYILMVIAAIAGDTTNYWLGRYVGPKVFERFLKKDYMDRTHAFYEKHGGKTIFLARFIPIIRTFAPFVAGVGKMRYGYFISYNIVGGIIWPAIMLFAGYFFGQNKFVQENFSLVVIAIIVVSFIPVVIEWINGLRAKKAAANSAVATEVDPVEKNSSIVD